MNNNTNSNNFVHQILNSFSLFPTLINNKISEPYTNMNMNINYRLFHPNSNNNRFTDNINIDNMNQIQDVNMEEVDDSQPIHISSPFPQLNIINTSTSNNNSNLIKSPIKSGEKRKQINILNNTSPSSYKSQNINRSVHSIHTFHPIQMPEPSAPPLEIIQPDFTTQSIILQPSGFIQEKQLNLAVSGSSSSAAANISIIDNIEKVSKKAVLQAPPGGPQVISSSPLPEEISKLSSSSTDEKKQIEPVSSSAIETKIELTSERVESKVVNNLLFHLPSRCNYCPQELQQSEFRYICTQSECMYSICNECVHVGHHTKSHILLRIPTNFESINNNNQEKQIDLEEKYNNDIKLKIKEPVDLFSQLQTRLTDWNVKQLELQAKQSLQKSNSSNSNNNNNNNAILSNKFQSPKQISPNSNSKRRRGEEQSDVNSNNHLASDESSEHESITSYKCQQCNQSIISRYFTCTICPFFHFCAECEQNIDSQAISSYSKHLSSHPLLMFSEPDRSRELLEITANYHYQTILYQLQLIQVENSQLKTTINENCNVKRDLFDLNTDFHSMDSYTLKNSRLKLLSALKLIDEAELKQLKCIECDILYVKQVIFLPCEDQICCEKCARKLKDSKNCCPKCNREIQQIIIPK